MTRRSIPVILALAAALGCAGSYAERPAASGGGDRTPSDRASSDAEPPPARSAASEGTVVGHVTPDGRLHADTVAQAPAPDPVDRETVVTGHLRAADRTLSETREPAPGATGWRIQVFAASDEATAEEVARRAGEAADGTPVYVEAEGPWYKVRVGDFETREATEALRARLVGLGWTEAWAVRTAIHAP